MKRVLLAATVLLLAGCGVNKDGTIHSSVDTCAPALPVAKKLLGSGATLERLRRLSLEETQKILREAGAAPLTRDDAVHGNVTPVPTVTAGPDGPRPCVLSFSGSFTAAALAGDYGVSGTSGKYAVLVTTTRHPVVLRVALTDTDPLK